MDACSKAEHASRRSASFPEARPTVRKCIADGVDLASLTLKPEQPAIRMALKSRNLEMIKLLLPLSSHADKLETLALVIETHPTHRNGLRPGIAAILDSAKKANLGDSGWKQRQEEIAVMTKLLARFR